MLAERCELSFAHGSVHVSFSVSCSSTVGPHRDYTTLQMCTRPHPTEERKALLFRRSSSECCICAAVWHCIHEQALRSASHRRTTLRNPCQSAYRVNIRLLMGKESWTSHTAINQLGRSWRFLCPNFVRKVVSAAFDARNQSLRPTRQLLNPIYSITCCWSACRSCSCILMLHTLILRSRQFEL